MQIEIKKKKSKQRKKEKMGEKKAAKRQFLKSQLFMKVL